MKKELDETVLTGGNVNTVVKIGNTVRRKTSPQSPNIHALLLHLETNQLAAPRFLGIDDQGREILSYIEGETEFPDDLWQDMACVRVSATLLRNFHDASVDFVTPHPEYWAYAYPDKLRHEVISHNDFAPYNMVFRRDGSISIIDFDLCGPGPRSRDIAYLAYWMTPLSFGSNDLKAHSKADLESGCPRLKLLLDTYGFSDRIEILEMVSEVLHHMSDEAAAIKMIGVEAANGLKSGGHFKHWAAEAAAFDEKMDVLVARLS